MERHFDGGSDIVVASVSYTIPANVEALVENGNGLTGTGSAVQRYVNARVKGLPIEALKIPFAAAATRLADGKLVLFNRGGAYLQSGQADRAVADFDRAIELEPGNPDCYFGRSKAHMALGRYSEAWADVRSIRRLDR